jgi:hypothetical protein
MNRWRLGNIGSKMVEIQDKQKIKSLAMNYKEMKYVKTFCNIHQSKCSWRSEVRVKKEGLPKDYK